MKSFQDVQLMIRRFGKQHKPVLTLKLYANTGRTTSYQCVMHCPPEQTLTLSHQTTITLHTYPNILGAKHAASAELKGSTAEIKRSACLKISTKAKVPGQNHLHTLATK